MRACDCEGMLERCLFSLLPASLASRLHSEPLPTYPIAVSYLALVSLIYAHFIVTTITQICDFLHIRCFKIPYPKSS